MKPLILGIAVAALLGGTALGASGSNWVLQQGKNLCLRSDHIQRKTIVDNRTIVFDLDDGTKWKNTLQHDCAGLKLADGFSMKLRDNYVCANRQPIRLTPHGNTCYLGGFTQVAKPPSP
jgi:hypothetical protein